MAFVDGTVSHVIRLHPRNQVLILERVSFMPDTLGRGFKCRLEFVLKLLLFLFRVGREFAFPDFLKLKLHLRVGVEPTNVLRRNTKGLEILVHVGC